VTPSAVIQSAVIQVKPGIGGVIWHLPFIRAIAAATPGGQVTFFAPPSSGAGELLQAEPAVAGTIYFQHFGSELQRGVNLIRLVALLRRQRLRSLWILDRTIRPALAAALAGIPARIGLGLGSQSLFITNRGHRPRTFSRSSDRLAARLDGRNEGAVAVHRAGFAFTAGGIDYCR
jgi:heptosyltransferase-2